jgi:hypothetical protein
MSRSRGRKQKRSRERGHLGRPQSHRQPGKKLPQAESLLASLCAEFAQLDGALEAELFASDLLGIPWEDRGFQSPEEVEQTAGIELVTQIAGVGGPGAAALLMTIGKLASPTMAKAASAALEDLGPGVKQPEWVGAIGSATPTRTAVLSDPVFDDSRIYLIESVNRDGERDVIGVLVDNNLACAARDIMLADSLDEIRQIYQQDPLARETMNFEQVEPALVSARLRAALELTDMTLDPPVSEDYSSLRTLAFNRVAALPEADADTGAPEVTEEERSALVAEFLDSPESEGIDRESDAADLVDTAINFCCDYVDGLPLRWSPATVEIFLTDWLPRKAIADDDYFDAVPDALRAWLRFAGRKRGMPAEAIEQNLAAVTEFSVNLAEDGTDPSFAGPGKELGMALADAGIDMTDEKELKAFIAGWNARSTLDLD